MSIAGIEEVSEAEDKEQEPAGRGTLLSEEESRGFIK